MPYNASDADYRPNNGTGDYINRLFSFFIFSSPLFLLQKPRPMSRGFCISAGRIANTLQTQLRSQHPSGPSTGTFSIYNLSVLRRVAADNSSLGIGY